MHDRLAVLDIALSLSRGPALGGVTEDDDARQRLAGGIDESVLAAREDRVEVLLRLYRSEAVLPELLALGAEYPDRPRVIVAIMWALYSSGRDKDALAVYAKARKRSVEEYGIELPLVLQDLHRQMLAQGKIHAASLLARPQQLTP